MRTLKFVAVALIVGTFAGYVRAHPADESLELRARTFAENLTARNYAALRPTFDSTMLALASEQKLAEIWSGIIEKIGAFNAIDGVHVMRDVRFTYAYVHCTFQNGPFDIKIVYDAHERVGGFSVVPPHTDELWSAPVYAVADSIREKPVSLGAPPWLLHGTLTVPKGNGPFPVVVLVHGSGPNDRDETIGPNKPFKDLAWGLATRGVAVLRYEKRTREHAALFTGETLDTITARSETIDDAVAAVAMLRGRDEIDPHRIFVLGHSLGGMLVPRIAARDTAIAGIIMFAGTTRPLEDVYLEQMEYLIGRDTLDSDTARERLREVRSQVAEVKSEKLSPSTPASFLPMGAHAQYWLDLRGYDPATLAATLHCPMLVLQGERDYQVTMEDFARWKSALASHANATFITYPDCNHLFEAGKGKSQPGEYEVPAHVEQKVVEDVARWVRAR